LPKTVAYQTGLQMEGKSLHGQETLTAKDTGTTTS